MADKLNPARLTKWQEEEASARKAKQTHQREQATGEQGPGEVEVRWRVRSPEGKESSCPGQPSRGSGAVASESSCPGQPSGGGDAPSSTRRTGEGAVAHYGGVGGRCHVGGVGRRRDEREAGFT